MKRLLGGIVVLAGLVVAGSATGSEAEAGFCPETDPFGVHPLLYEYPNYPRSYCWYGYAPGHPSEHMHLCGMDGCI